MERVVGSVHLLTLSPLGHSEGLHEPVFTGGVWGPMIHQHVGWGSYYPIQNLEAPKKESDILNITGYSLWLIKSNQPKKHWFPLIGLIYTLFLGGTLGGGRLTIAINSWKDCCVLVPENMFDNCWVGISLYKHVWALLACLFAVTSMCPWYENHAEKL